MNGVCRLFKGQKLSSFKLAKIARLEGWVLYAGAADMCEFMEDQSMVMVDTYAGEVLFKQSIKGTDNWDVMELHDGAEAVIALVLSAMSESKLSWVFFGDATIQ